MTYTVKANGLEVQQQRLSHMISEIKHESEEMVAVMLQAVSAQTMPYVPVDTSALINSEYRFTQQIGKNVIGTIGYGDPSAASFARGTPVTEYAVYVHDGPQKNWQKPGASNRYLEKGLSNFLSEDFNAIIARYTG